MPRCEMRATPAMMAQRMPRHAVVYAVATRDAMLMLTLPPRVCVELLSPRSMIDTYYAAIAALHTR